MPEHKHPKGYLQNLVRTGYPDRPDECWLWPGAKTRGYGRVWFGGRLQLAHRIAYELHVGPIPDGLMLDHTCHVHDCFNPAHLEPVTHVQNMQNRDGLNANNTSGHRGVYWHRRKSRWMVEVTLGGVKRHGGYFHSIDDAVAAAEQLRKDLCFRDTTAHITDR